MNSRFLIRKLKGSDQDWRLFDLRSASYLPLKQSLDAREYALLSEYRKGAGVTAAQLEVFARRTGLTRNPEDAFTPAPNERHFRGVTKALLEYHKDMLGAFPPPIHPLQLQVADIIHTQYQVRPSLIISGGAWKLETIVKGERHLRLTLDCHVEYQSPPPLVAAVEGKLREQTQLKWYGAKVIGYARHYYALKVDLHLPTYLNPESDPNVEFLGF